MTVHRFITFDSYIKYRQSSSSYTSNFDTAFIFKLFYWNANAGGSTGYTEEIDSEDIETFFELTNGEIYVSELICSVYTMRINEFAKLEFTDAFKNALRSLHHAANLEYGK